MLTFLRDGGIVGIIGDCRLIQGSPGKDGSLKGILETVKEYFGVVQNVRSFRCYEKI